MAIDTNENHVSNRRAASTKQAESVAQTKWPLLGGAAYAKLARGDASGAKSPKVVRLAHARNKLYQALQAVDAAIRETNPQVKGGDADGAVYNALRSHRPKLEKLYVEFPLEVR